MEDLFPTLHYTPDDETPYLKAPVLFFTPFKRTLNLQCKMLVRKRSTDKIEKT